MKKVFYLIWLFIVFIFSMQVVYANDIKSINMDIYVDSEGDAHVTETWYATLNSGTEGYKPYYNLGNSKIKDLKVSMNGTYFTTLSVWNTEATFNEKAYKAGIHYINNGLELCFGMSTYGTNTYVLEYTITKFVSTLDDADMIYWTLISSDLSDNPEYVYIKIYSDFAYEDALPVWGYGYNGYAYVYDGYIELVSENGLKNNEYMVVLVKFPKGTFNTTSVLDENFTYYFDMAQEGATENYNTSSEDSLEDILGYMDDSIKIMRAVILFEVRFIFYCVIILIIVILLKKKNKPSKKIKYGTKRLKFGKGEKNLKDTPYFRDIPCNKDVFKAYWVACEYNLVKKNTDFLGAILLKWLKDGNVENILYEKTQTRALRLVTNNNLNELEQELYAMMLDASKDGVLAKNYFKNYCNIYYNKVLKWFDKAMDYATNEFVLEGLITEKWGGFHKNYIVSSSMKGQALEMAGLKKFLKDFTLIKDKEPIQVYLWQYYLIYAQIFGIAEEVAKEFKKLYPDVISEAYFEDIVFIRGISLDSMTAASDAKTSAEAHSGSTFSDRARSYSSGGGGFSSSGGGGGSFGGGGGDSGGGGGHSGGGFR